MPGTGARPEPTMKPGAGPILVPGTSVPRTGDSPVGGIVRTRRLADAFPVVKNLRHGFRVAGNHAVNLFGVAPIASVAVGASVVVVAIAGPGSMIAHARSGAPKTAAAPSYAGVAHLMRLAPP